MPESPSVHRRNHKWAMVGYKGGKCIRCDERVTESNIEKFHFDHKVPVNNCSDNTDRWCGGGVVRDWPPFTEKWFAWADRIDLMCEECHIKRHRPHNKQLSLLDFEAVQARLDEFEERAMRRNGNGAST